MNLLSIKNSFSVDELTFSVFQIFLKVKNTKVSGVLQASKRPFFFFFFLKFFFHHSFFFLFFFHFFIYFCFKYFLFFQWVSR